MQNSVRLAVLAVLLACSGLVSSCGGLTDRADPPSSPQEEAVYAAVLAQRYAAPTYVLMDTTGTDDFGQPLDETLQNVVQRMHDVAPELPTSFMARNQASRTLGPDMSLGAPYVLLTDAEVSQIFSPGSDPSLGWQTFYSKYPEARGIITLSRVGFNAAGDEALVYVGSQFESLGAEGLYYLLVRQGDAWVVDQQAVTWVS
jgi:hypothetical protein